MAQLRDSQTSELLAEGTPAEMVALADELGADEVIFDDVGEAFDPAAVRDANEGQAVAIAGAADRATAKAEKARLREAAKAMRDELKPTKAAVDKARKRLKEARARIGG